MSDPLRLDEHLAAIEAAIGDARQGMPEAVFRFLSRVSPVVNVDLLIRNDRAETLLTWREDDLFRGWHVPGGVIRYKEDMAHRVSEVARLELGATVRMSPKPLAIHEIIEAERRERGHFISFLFGCTLTSGLDDSLGYREGSPRSGEWAWHASAPRDLLDVHDVYRRFIDARA